MNGMRRPPLISVHKVLDRMEAISRKYGAPLAETQRPKDVFVDVLDGLAAGKKKSAEIAKDSADEVRSHIARCAEDYNIDEELIRAVIQVESGGRSDAVSSKGAQGLMQLMPRTAKMLGVEDPFDPQQNIEGGVKYLSQLTDKYKGDVEKALAAYNAGPSRVDARGAAPFPETARYVKNVMALYHRYREET